jgi:NADPH:quinone reductase-like Zn-dependent oxidoreductase
MSKQTVGAIRVHTYGGPEELKFEQIALPVPHEDEVLVRVHAIGVNPVDWKIRAGWMKDFVPVQFPYIPGADFAGVVEAVGPGVTAFQPGQDVFGRGSQGTYAEYITVSVGTTALKPKSLSFAEAATIPVGATTAWQGLFDQGELQTGQRVLILGASGGVGLFAVQFARWKGAHVIATTSRKNIEYVSSLGAETVIDYTHTQVEDVVRDVDLVLDTVGGDALASVLPVLKRGGTLISIAGQPDEEKAKALNVRTGRFSAQVSGELLHTFVQLIDEGQIKTTVFKQYPLSQASHAHTLSESRHGLGRIVLTAGE